MPFLAIIAMALVRGGHVGPPQPEGPDIFSLASEERTRELLEDAGFASVRTEEVAVRFSFDDIDQYVGMATDTSGPLAMVLRGLSHSERDALKGQQQEPLAPFATGAGYEFPGVALCAAAS